jgi:2-keto-4-pentenoate hydratase/2-oxohepta-3-ene-1,7-dioic acid hydratase in catechol pathway
VQRQESTMKLKPGDTIEVETTKIGVPRNPVVSEE